MKRVLMLRFNAELAAMPAEDFIAKVLVNRLAAREVWGHEVTQLVFYNLENNTAIATTRNGAQLEEAKQRVQEVAQDIAEGKFYAKPGYQCVFCPYRNLCPATEKVIFVTPKKTARAS